MKNKNIYIIRIILLLPVLLSLAACSSHKGSGSRSSHYSSGSFGSGNFGKFYSNDGPPAGYSTVEIVAGNAVPRVEKPIAATNKPYEVLGKKYTPVTGDRAMVQTGIGSWYGKKFHGKKTSTGEIYNMYSMTAAHTTMELPSYAKVTNLENGKSVIVKVNDRGPFLHERVIDLSYAAATKLGYAGKGTAQVRVERITMRQIALGKIPSANAGGALATLPMPSTRPAPAFQPPAVKTTPQTEEDEIFALLANEGIQEYAAPSSSSSRAPTGAQRINEGEFVIAGGEGSIPPPPVAPPRKPSGFAIQLGAFKTAANADALAHRANEILTLSEPDARVVEVDGWYKVLVGGNMDRPKATSYVVKLSKELGQQGIVVKDI